MPYKASHQALYLEIAMVGRHKNSRKPKEIGKPDPAKDRTTHEAARGKSKTPGFNLSDKQFSAVVAEINDGSDRVTAILGAGLVQNMLIGALLTCLKDQSESDKLFDDRGPFNSFYSQILAGRALGLFTSEAAKALHTIRSIRNYFAHEVDVLTFDSPEVAKKCLALDRFQSKQTNERRAKLSQNRCRYEDACYTVAAQIMAAGTANIKKKTSIAQGMAARLGADTPWLNSLGRILDDIPPRNKRGA